MAALGDLFPKSSVWKWGWRRKFPVRKPGSCYLGQVIKANTVCDVTLTACTFDTTSRNCHFALLSSTSTSVTPVQSEKGARQGLVPTGEGVETSFRIPDQLGLQLLGHQKQGKSEKSCYRSGEATRTWDLLDRFLGFPRGTGGKEPACQCRRHKICRFDPWVRKIPWRRAWQPTAVLLPGESHGQRSLAGYPWDRKESGMAKDSFLEQEKDIRGKLVK